MTDDQLGRLAAVAYMAWMNERPVPVSDKAAATWLREAGEQTRRRWQACVEAVLAEHDCCRRREEAEAERDHYRKVLSRIAEQCGHPPIARGELYCESVGEAVAARVRHMDDLSERLESVTPDWLERFAASAEHHDEHHRREESLERKLTAAEAERDALADENAELRRIRSEQAALLRGDAVILVPVPMTQAFEELRTAGGADWDAIADPEKFLGRKEPAKPEPVEFFAGG